MEGIKQARVSARIDQATKDKAEQELAKRGLSISDFIRMNLTTVANEGLPAYYGIPNETTMAAIYEMVEDLKNRKGYVAHPYEELQRMLEED